MRTLFISFFILLSLNSAFAEDFFLHKSSQEVANDILMRFKSSNAQLLLLAEAGHEQLEFMQFFTNMWDDTFQFIALEIHADKQPIIDAFMRGEANELKIERGGAEINAELTQFLLKIRRLNQMTDATGLPPIAILAIDKPIEKGETSQQWFQARDPFMFDQLRKRIEAGQKGLLYMGGGHLTRNPLPTPRILRKSYGMPESMDNLGAKLERFIPDRILRVWMDAAISPLVTFGMMPPDMGYLLRIDPALRSAMYLDAEKTFAIATQDAEFLKAEKKAHTRRSIPMLLSKEFDYYVSLARGEKKRPYLCEAMLNSRGFSLLFSGLMMRLL